MHPLPALLASGSLPTAGGTLGGLAIYLLLIAAAAVAGGSSMAFVSLGHRPMQVLLSLTGGVLLGVGMLHLLPHASFALGGGVEAAAGWAVVGFFAMFLLERAFHGHAHHGHDEHGHAHHGHDEHGPEHHGPEHHGPEHHGHHHHGHASGYGAAGRWAWCGALAGLTLHSLADGAALAASVRADAAHGDGIASGFATFLAICLHKPLDAAIIAMLLINAGASPRFRRLVNLGYALVVPLGALVFLTGLRWFGGHEGDVLGIAMALAAGAFICIAAADLLPEVQFHSHDRLLLTTALAVGLAIAWGITVVERSTHAHESHATPASAERDGHRHHHRRAPEGGFRPRAFPHRGRGRAARGGPRPSPRQ
jgi:zinc and cadmium transporter